MCKEFIKKFFTEYYCRPSENDANASLVEPISLFVSIIFMFMTMLAWFLNSSIEERYHSCGGFFFASVFFLFIWVFIRGSRKDMNATAYLFGAFTGVGIAIGLKFLGN